MKNIKTTVRPVKSRKRVKKINEILWKNSQIKLHNLKYLLYLKYVYSKIEYYFKTEYTNVVHLNLIFN